MTAFILYNELYKETKKNLNTLIFPDNIIQYYLKVLLLRRTGHPRHCPGQRVNASRWRDYLELWGGGKTLQTFDANQSLRQFKQGEGGVIGGGVWGVDVGGCEW